MQDSGYAQSNLMHWSAEEHKAVLGVLALARSSVLSLCRQYAAFLRL